MTTPPDGQVVEIDNDTTVRFVLNGSVSIEINKEKAPDGTEVVVLYIPHEESIQASSVQEHHVLQLQPGASNVVFVSVLKVGAFPR
jgi:hypothetical protein